MNVPDLTPLLAAAAVSGACALIVSMTAPLTPSKAAGGSRALPPGEIAVPDTLVAWAALAPFRRNRQAPARRFDATLVNTQAVAAQAERAPRPQLILRGIVLGATPIALIEGLPGIEGARGLRQGERLGGLLIGRVERERVRVTAVDTTWTLEIREPGK